VDAATLLREARWVTDVRNLAHNECGRDPNKYRAFYRKAHAERLAAEHGMHLDYRKLPLNNFVEIGADHLFGGRGHGHHRKHPQALSNQGKAHYLLTAYPLPKVESVYKFVFERILNEKITTQPVVQNK
jgi:hypothetical protein